MNEPHTLIFRYRRQATLCATTLLSAATLVAFAQVPLTEAPPDQASPATAGIVATPAPPLDPAEQIGPIVLSKMPLPQVLDLLQTYSGRVVIPAAGLPAPELTFKSAGKLRRDEAILALETLLRLNGVMLVAEKDGLFLQAVPSAQVMQRGPVLLEAPPTDDQAAQQVFGRIFELRHMDSSTMYHQVVGMLSPGVSSILNLHWRDALLIFDTRHNLEAVGKVIEMLDQPPQHRAEVFVVPVKNSTVHSVYYALLHAQRHGANAALYKARFHIDGAANHLVVVAPPESKAYIMELASRLDEEIAPLTTSRVFTVRKGNVRTVYGILLGIIRHQQGMFARQGFRSTEIYRQTQAEAQAPGARAAPEGEAAAPPPEDATPPPVETVITDLAAAARDLEFSPYMYIWLDSQNNAIVAYGTPADLKRAAALVEQLDQESTPYIVSETMNLRYTYAPGIAGALNHMVAVQRSLFARQGLASGEARAGEASVQSPETGETAFEFSPYLYLFADRAGNTILAFGTRSDVEKIKELVGKLDQEQSPVTRSKTVTIQHTQATTVAGMISRIIYMQRVAYQRQGLYTGQTREDGAAPGLPDGVTVEVGFEFTPYAMVTADRTSNALFIYGTERDLRRMEELIANLDQESAPITRSKVYYLEHAEAYTLSRIISQVIYAQRRIFQSRGLRTSEDMPGGAAEIKVEMTMGFEFSDFATVVADRRSNSILIYGTDGDIARVDEIIRETDIAVEPMTTSRVFPLKHADANNLSRVLQIIVTSQRRAMGSVESASERVRNLPEGDAAPPAAVEGEPAVQFSQFLSIVPDARNNALIVYGTHDDVKHVATLVEQTDVEVAPLTRSEVFFLEYARARSLASILTQMIRGQQSAMRMIQSRFRAVHYPGTEGEEDEPLAPIMYDPSQPMQFSPYVSVVANDRSNSLLAYGTEADIEQLRAIIGQSDVAVAPRTQSRIFYVKHADANEIVLTINPLVVTQQRVRERELSLRRFFRGGGRGEEGEETGVGESPEGGPLGFEDLPATMDTALAEAGLNFDQDLQFSPYVSLTADDRSNAVIAYGTQFDLDQIENLISQIDRVLPQVRIEVVIAEVLLIEGQVSGLSSFGLSYDNPFEFQTGEGIVAAGNAAAAAGGDSGGAPIVGRGGLIASGPELDTDSGRSFDLSMTFDPFSLQTVFRVAREDNNVRVLSAPAITTTHNRPASINVGEARPIITSSAANLNNPDLVTRSEIEYRDIGIELKVRPLVSEEGYIQLDIEQVVETVIDEQTIDNNVQPIIGTRRANSFVSVRNEQVIVMGGLQSVVSNTSEGRVWLLGDIPLIGIPFRPKKRTTTVRELIIFIRPKLVDSIAEEEMIASERARPGAVTEDVVIYLESGRFPEQEQLDNLEGEREVERADELDRQVEVETGRVLAIEPAPAGAEAMREPTTPEAPPATNTNAAAPDATEGTGDGS